MAKKDFTSPALDFLTQKVHPRRIVHIRRTSHTGGITHTRRTVHPRHIEGIKSRGGGCTGLI